MDQEKILVIGACGQIGRELTAALRLKFGQKQVLASDIQATDNLSVEVFPYHQLDVTDVVALEKLITGEQVTQIYHLAAMLSATGEKHPKKAWDLNMDSLLSVLDLSVKYNVKKVFWPSSIAVFGPDSEKKNTPQQGITEPSTVYGISKAAGEYWCKYYFEKFGLDVRSIRYPGLISYTGAPGGGTTDYAVDIFHHAVEDKPFTCFLKKDTVLPMMYMADAIRATLELMDAPVDNIKVRTSYNLSGLSFSPEELSKEIEKLVEGFKVDYMPDFRQQIADSWPGSIDDRTAQKDWGWKPAYDLKAMVNDMLLNLRELQEH
ncbi:NAD-dependent epimerase/dehydratase family protein [Pedobacter psychrodurus]|uniref:NAD-dependent epimerase/dehydratase family protein n=1 Tax=Pedobacter psychrodurus TaxID=2530456 RepID=UPI00292D1B06|nr:NAD-dependent epimerase/dehydratase family protein [Pedobacter psychrodurus]